MSYNYVILHKTRLGDEILPEKLILMEDFVKELFDQRPMFSGFTDYEWLTYALRWKFNNNEVCEKSITNAVSVYFAKDNNG